MANKIKDAEPEDVQFEETKNELVIPDQKPDIKDIIKKTADPFELRQLFHQVLEFHRHDENNEYNREAIGADLRKLFNINEMEDIPFGITYDEEHPDRVDFELSIDLPMKDKLAMLFLMHNFE